jgi:hypothetical protein
MAKKKDIEVSKEPVQEVKHWLDEIGSAKKREKDYRKEGQEIIDIYSGEKSDQIPFNILFSNVETLLPSLFSQTPRPIVKRRFDDTDPVGAAASKAGQRMLKYLLDTNIEGYETFEDSIGNATLDALLPGRGITSIKYDADIKEVKSSEEDTETTPVKKWESVCTDSRSWDKVYFGYAKKWSKVPWIAYEDYLDEEECERMFGEDVTEKIEFTEGEDDDEENKRSRQEENKGSRKTALIYQIWDKVGDKKIRYISPAYNEGYLKVDDDHLEITGFFNCPKPMQFIKKSDNLMPTAMYTLYENQAKELNTLTLRIQHITKAIKARGAYDGALGNELGKIMEGDDNELIPTDKGSSLVDGGLSKAIWFMPIEQMIVVLQQLIAAREACKRTIYEITGISDILRGQSQASETLGAQKIKEAWGGLRLKRLQQEVQRYARDVLRIMLEVSASKMSEETWAKATGLPYPTAEQKKQAQNILQAMQKQAQQMPPPQPPQPGQPPAPPPQPPQPNPQVVQAANSPSWEEILNILKDDLLRSYKIDIETNSTIDVEATEDQKNVADFMNAMGQMMAGLAPMVQNGSLPFDASKAILLEVVRKYRFGTEVEEQFSAMSAPQPQPNPEAEKAKQEMQLAQQQLQQKTQEMQQKAQMEQAKMQAEGQMAMQQLKADNQIAMAELQAKKESEMAIAEIKRDSELTNLQVKSEAENAKLQAQRGIEQMKADIQRDTAIKVAQINADAALAKNQMDCESKEKMCSMTEASKSATEDKKMIMNADGEEIEAPSENEEIRTMMTEILDKLNNKPIVDVEYNNMGKIIRLVPKQNKG